MGRRKNRNFPYIDEYHGEGKGGVRMKYTGNYHYNQPYDDTHWMHDKCNQYMNFHVMFSMKDGSEWDGIIENVSRDQVSVLVGEDVSDQENEHLGDRQYYGPPRRRYRRFRRRTFPLASLAALALLPYFAPSPYYGYPYSYY